MSSRVFYSTPCLGVLAALLTGCGGDSTAPAVIDYHQVGLCDVYTAPGGARAAKPNEVYVVYKIGAVDNTKRNVDFTFLPARLYVDRVTAQQQAEWKLNAPQSLTKPIGTADLFGQRNNRRYVSKDTGFAKTIGVRAAEPMVISHAAKMEINGYSIVAAAVPGENNETAINQTFFKLAYDPQEGDGESIPADPPVVLNNTNAAQTAWPHPANCEALMLQKPAS